MAGGITNVSFPQSREMILVEDNLLLGKTMLYKRGYVNGASNSMYTITAGKTFYIVLATLGYEATHDGANAYLWIGSATDRLLEAWANITGTYKTSDTNTIPLAFPHPLPVAAGVTIGVTSDHADMRAHASFVGWEE